MRVVCLAPLATMLAGAACAPGTAAEDQRLAPVARYALVAVSGQPLPYTPGSDGEAPDFRLVADTLAIALNGAIQQVRWVRMTMLERWPCDVLRQMRAAEATGESGGVTLPALPAPDTTGACDALRQDPDTARGRLIDRAGRQGITYAEPFGSRGDAMLAWRADTLELTFPDAAERYAYRRVP